MSTPVRRSLRFQMIAVLIFGLMISHVIGFVLYSTERRAVMSISEAFEFAERASGVVSLLRNVPADWRKDVLHASDQRAFRVWGESEPVVTPRPPSPEEERLLDYLHELLPQLDREEIRVAISPGFSGGAPGGFSGPADAGSSGRVVSISIRNTDGSWLNFAGVSPTPPSLWPSLVAGYLISIVFGVTVIAFWLVRRATRPLEQFALAAERLGKNLEASPLAESGPAEVVRAAGAFNLMQERLARLVRERTELLAAVSHDLRTPITQLKLRTELIEDQAEREKFFAALDEMELTVSTFLDYARSTFGAEERSRIDLASLIESIGDDMSDAGADVEVAEAERIHFDCKRLALKRGVTNLIDNAIKYAGSARVEVMRREADIVIRIDDDGPGIEQDQLQEMMTPFRRGDPSRNRRTGGVGLGLSIAQAAAGEHGGRLVLMNRPEGGLRAEIIMPA